MTNMCPTACFARMQCTLNSNAMFRRSLKTELLFDSNDVMSHDHKMHLIGHDKTMSQNRSYVSSSNPRFPED